MADFICKSLDTAISSVADWIGTDATELKRKLSYNLIAEYENDLAAQEHDFCYFLSRRFMPAAAGDKVLPRVHWFHGTRCLDPDCFRYGILPLNEILPSIKANLDMLAQKNGIPPSMELTARGQHLGWLMSIKQQSLPDQGPCAMLNYEAAVRPELFSCHNYTEMPEIIEDYAHVAYGDQAEPLLKSYMAASVPAVVEFWAFPNGTHNPSMESIIGTVLMYAYALIHPEDDMLGLYCNTCYSGNGKPIMPEQILGITILQQKSEGEIL